MMGSRFDDESFLTSSRNGGQDSWPYAGSTRVHEDASLFLQNSLDLGDQVSPRAVTGAIHPNGRLHIRFRRGADVR